MEFDKVTPKINCDDAAVKERLTRIAERVRCGYTINVIGNEELNAWINSTYEIYITASLIKFCQSDDEIAAIIAHECAHEYLGHFNSKYNEIAEGVLRGMQGAEMDAGTIKETVKVMKVAIPIFSKGNEFEADIASFERVCSSGYDRKAMAALFTRMSDLKGDRKGIAKLLSSHPPFADRIKKLNDQEPLIPQYEPLIATFKSVEPDKFVTAVQKKGEPVPGYQMLSLDKKHNIFLFVQSATPVKISGKKKLLVLPPDTGGLVALFIKPPKPFMLIKATFNWEEGTVNTGRFWAGAKDYNEVTVPAMAVRFFPKDVLTFGDELTFTNKLWFGAVSYKDRHVFKEKVKLDVSQMTAAKDPGCELPILDNLKIGSPYYQK